MLYRLVVKWKIGLLLPFLLLHFAHAAQPDMESTLTEGVAAYRDGRYLDAEKCFQQVHARHPENSKATYYFAITQAQLGRFKQAKSLYQEILTLDPNSEAAKLAQQGLSFLPEDTALDQPPRFQASGKAEKQPYTDPDNTTPKEQSQTGMSPQDMMMWQMMMAQMGGNQQGGMNPWALMMMPQMTGNGQNAPKIDPNVMSNMLMNQMMQNFSLEGSRQDN